MRSNIHIVFCVRRNDLINEAKAKEMGIEKVSAACGGKCACFFSSGFPGEADLHG
jgi:hypothetical protein